MTNTTNISTNNETKKNTEAKKSTENSKETKTSKQEIKTGDFIELNYTGMTKDKSIFDTTIEKVAKLAKIHNPKQKYGPAKICVGQGQILPGLDEGLNGKKSNEKYIVTIPTEKAFGKRNVKNVQLVPLSTFKAHNLRPFPGLQVDFDGNIGRVMRVSGGRVMVNFNHPLAGKDLVYEVKITRKITNPKEKLEIFLANVLQLKPEFMKVTIDEKNPETATITMPFQLPEPISEKVTGKVLELIPEIKKLNFEVDQKAAAAIAAKHAPGQ